MRLIAVVATTALIVRVMLVLLVLDHHTLTVTCQKASVARSSR